MVDTIDKAQVAQDFISSIVPLEMGFSARVDGDRFSASSYYPKGDCARDKFCHGADSTLAGAVEKMLAKVEQAKLEKPVLKTAAECKEAVLNLIREHNAAPASFRDAVDALPVKP